jgi:hypothetical protein
MPNTEPPVPALVPVANWSRVRILLDGEPLLASEGEVLLGTRKLDMRRGVLVSAWTHRTPAGITVAGRELRLLSQADRAAGLQLLQLWLDRDGVDVRLEASCDGRPRDGAGAPGAGPRRLAYRGYRKGVAMTGAATLRLGDEVLAPSRPFSLRWAWHWRSAAGQVAEFDRLIAVAPPAQRWHAAVRLAGAPCWPRTRLPGFHAFEPLDLAAYAERFARWPLPRSFPGSAVDTDGQLRYQPRRCLPAAPSKTKRKDTGYL